MICKTCDTKVQSVGECAKCGADICTYCAIDPNISTEFSNFICPGCEDELEQMLDTITEFVKPEHLRYLADKNTDTVMKKHW